MPITERQYEVFFDILDKIINQSTPVPTKKEEFTSNMSQRDETNIQELCAWFAEEE